MGDEEVEILYEAVDEKEFPKLALVMGLIEGKGYLGEVIPPGQRTRHPPPADMPTRRS